MPDSGPFDLELNLVTTVFADTYDVLTISAGLGEGHIPCGALYEMIRVVKPGESVNELVDKI